LYLAVDGHGRPLAVRLTGGQRHERTQLLALLDAIRVSRPGGHGRPWERPAYLLADRGYSSSTCRRLLRRRGIAQTIPTRVDQRGRPGRPAAFDPVRYGRRNLVERCVNRLKQWRGIATTRFDKPAANYRAGVVIVSLVLWLAHSMIRRTDPSRNRGSITEAPTLTVEALPRYRGCKGSS
jgi:transposase